MDREFGNAGPAQAAVTSIEAISVMRTTSSRRWWTADNRFSALISEILLVKMCLTPW